MAGRAIVVGDPNQSLYGFRGADAQAFPRIAAMLAANGRGMVERILPKNYRCDAAIIENAQQWVPGIIGNSAALGTVDEINFYGAIERANNNGTDIELPDGIDGQVRSLPLPGKDEVSFAFLCRINLPIIVTAYQLIGAGKRVCIIGRKQIGQPLINLINDVCGTDENDPAYTNRIADKMHEGTSIEDGLLSRLNSYYKMQSEKLQDEKYEAKLEALQQNIECLEVICERVKDNKVSGVIAEIENLFTEDPTPGVISLSTVHRAKGLEWDVVFILRPELMPHPRAKSEDEIQQEMNACYVGATRPRHRLYYVTDWPFGNGKPSKRVQSRPVTAAVDEAGHMGGVEGGNSIIVSKPDGSCYFDMPAYDKAVKQLEAANSVQISGVASTHVVKDTIRDIPAPKFVDDGKPF